MDVNKRTDSFQMTFSDDLTIMRFRREVSKKYQIRLETVSDPLTLLRYRKHVPELAYILDYLGTYGGD